MTQLVVCGPGHSDVSWEPGANRHVDLPALVAANSPSGAADVHLACAWGLGSSTAVSERGWRDVHLAACGWLIL